MGSIVNLSSAGIYVSCPLIKPYQKFEKRRNVKKSDKLYLRVKEVDIDFFTFLYTELNDKSNGPIIISVTQKFAVIKVLKVEK